MKQILTLLVCITVFTSVQAQTPQEEARRVILGQKKTGDGNGSPNGRDIILGGDRRVEDERGSRYPNTTTREQSVDQVNREYDVKIQSIRNNPYLSSAEKERAIRQLNIDRARRIREVNSRNGDRRYEKRNDRNDDSYEHSDNGKHKGWEKGKGNQKKYKKHGKG